MEAGSGLGAGVAAVGGGADGDGLSADRDLTRTETTIRIVTFQGLWMSAFMVVPALLVWQMPSLQVWLIPIGALHRHGGQWAMVLAAKHAEASMITPFDYLRLPFVALLELTVLGVVRASLAGARWAAAAITWPAAKPGSVRALWLPSQRCSLRREPQAAPFRPQRRALRSSRALIGSIRSSARRPTAAAARSGPPGRLNRLFRPVVRPVMRAVSARRARW